MIKTTHRFNKKNFVLCLMGPTASGKTNVALGLAKHLPIEIVSVDSAAIYREMNIGTAKPSLKERQTVPHHLIDLRDPSECYSAADFVKDAQPVVDAIHSRNHIPVLCGGTMLYFSALQNGLSPLPSADPLIRQGIDQEAHQIGWKKLHARLTIIDPLAAKRIHENDTQRIQRALEVFEITGQPLSELQNQSPITPSPYLFINFVFSPKDRAALHQRIQQRFEHMLQAGFVDEVLALFQRGDLHENLPSIRSIGYRQIWQHLSGQYDLDMAKEKAITATRQFAKRQPTRLRSWKEAIWFDSLRPDLLQTVVKALNFRLL
jgi:tRNA dimethylallyltransferase